MNLELYNKACEQIASAYEISGNRFGYKFLYCPKERLENHNGILVFGLNPGGEVNKCQNEVAEGLAYDVEKWVEKNGRVSPIRDQVMTLLSRLSNEPENTLASNIVFFRSKSWKDIQNPNESISACIKIWKQIIPTLNGVNKVIYIGKLSFDLAMKHQLFKFNQPAIEIHKLWAGGSWQIYKDEKGVTHIVLPHLSRWRFIKNGDSHFEKLLANIK